MFVQLYIYIIRTLGSLVYSCCIIVVIRSRWGVTISYYSILSVSSYKRCNNYKRDDHVFTRNNNNNNSNNYVDDNDNIGCHTHSSVIHASYNPPLIKDILIQYLHVYYFYRQYIILYPYRFMVIEKLPRNDTCNINILWSFHASAFTCLIFITSVELSKFTERFWCPIVAQLWRREGVWGLPSLLSLRFIPRYYIYTYIYVISLYVRF